MGTFISAPKPLSVSCISTGSEKQLPECSQRFKPLECTKFLSKNRLSTPGEFKAVFQAAQKISSHHLAVFFKKNNLEYARLGIIVAKRNICKAVERNLVRRVIRESFRWHQLALYGLDIVVIVYRPYSLLSLQEMRKVIDERWKKYFI